MLNRTRQHYINKQSQDAIKTIPSENIQTNEIGTMIIDTLKLLSKKVEDLKQSMKSMDEKLESLEVRQRYLEDQAKRNSTINGMSEIDLSSIRNELEILKTEKAKSKSYNPPPEKINAPIMPGKGFESITPEFLKSLKNR